MNDKDQPCYLDRFTESQIDAADRYRDEIKDKEIEDAFEKSETRKKPGIIARLCNLNHQEP